MKFQRYMQKFQAEIPALFATSFIAPFQSATSPICTSEDWLFLQFNEHPEFQRLCGSDDYSSVFFLYLQTLAELRSFIAMGTNATLSKLSSQTLEFGFGELLDSEFLRLDDNYDVQKEQRSAHNTMKLYKQEDLQQEAFGMLNISAEDQEKMEKPIFVNTMRTNANSIKKNNGYCNSIINWNPAEKYSFPIDKTDIVFSMCRYFRLFDSAICRLVNATTDIPRMTKQAYSHYLSLAEKDFLKKFIFYDGSSPTGNMRVVDSIIHNFELERLFHFSLLADILEIRQVAEKCLSKQRLEKLDSLLLLYSDLPFSYTRNERLKNTFSNVELERISAMDDSEYSKNIDKKARDLFVDAKYVWPIMQRTFFYSLMTSQTGKTVNENFVLASNHLNNILKSHENVAFARKKWEINSKNKLPDIKSLSISAVNFIYRFFTYNFTVEKYKERNDSVYDSNYFNLPIITGEDSESRKNKNIVQDLTLNFFLSK